MSRSRPSPATLRVGLVYETLESAVPVPGDPEDFHVEYESEATIAFLERCVARLGHRPVRLGSPAALLARGAEAPPVDVAWNIAEGRGGRNREALAPALLELHGIPALGSDALTLSLSLDKAWATRWVAAAGLPVPEQASFRSGSAAAAAPPAPYPLFVKPRWEGTSKGIRASSRADDADALSAEVDRVCAAYAQPALVERFLPGAEYTVSVVGHGAAARALPVLQRALEVETGIGLHALEGVHGALAPGPAAGRALAHTLPGDLDAALEGELQALSLRAFEVFACLDFARVDWRLDAGGRPRFLEINPLPTFAPDASFGILAELEGRQAEELVGDVVAAGLARLGLSV